MLTTLLLYVFNLVHNRNCRSSKEKSVASCSVLSLSFI